MATPSDISLPLSLLVGLYGLFAVKHLLADYFLQTSSMALGKGLRERWLTPLVAHASVHGSLTTAIAVSFEPRFWWLGVFDFFLHATIDRGKSLVGHAGNWTPADARFWWLHGVDQFLHQISHFGYILVIALN